MTKDIKRFTFRIPNELYENIKRLADSRGVSVNAYILDILKIWNSKTKLY